ncbi:glycoside hydrolase family 27 protein [Fibrella sp. WM1]|uniref:glycoside hydrolase family 27 protein n=1 Tax=Fibrella musci TaxID=3242485 RepID=UPI003520FD8C
MKFPLLIVGLFTATLGLAQPAPVAQTPPMGWTSHMALQPQALESEVRLNADYMAQNLSNHGWQYVLVDYSWAYPNPPEDNGGNPNQSRLANGTYVPLLNMDAHGRLLPDPRKFPSSKDGQGLRPLASYLHGLGLKFGLHVMRGIPRQAVWAKTPILGTDGITADQIADTVNVCPWLNHMYGVDMRKPGAQEYYNSLLELYGQWNVDYLKFDDMGLPGNQPVYHKDEVEAVRKAIDELRRPIIFSVAPAQPFDSSAHLREQANLFRISNDALSNWEQLKKQFDAGAQWAMVASAGHWPDAGRLPLGWRPKRNGADNVPSETFTDAEQRTRMTLWCMLKSPLLIDGNLPDCTPFTASLLTNDEGLAVNQEATNARPLSRTDDIAIWISDAADGQTKNVAIFNLSDESRPVTLTLSDVGIPKKANIRDVWGKAYKGQFKKTFTHQLAAHDAVLLRVAPVQ